MNPEHLRHSVGTTVARTAFVPDSAPWYWYDTDLLAPYYWNGAAWAALAGAGGAHNLLSATHADTTVQGPTQGSLIYADAVPSWNELVHPGSAGQSLISTATSVEWGVMPNWERVVVVAKSGGDYTLIQDAIDSIVDAAANKRYIVLIFPGDYAESITMKDYVDLVGYGRDNTRITGTTGTVLTFPATKGTVRNLGVEVNYGTLGANSTAITSAGADSQMIRCEIVVTKSAGDFLMRALTVTAGSFRLLDSNITYSITGATAGSALIQSAIVQIGVLTTFILDGTEVLVTSDDTNDHLVGFETNANVTGIYLLSNNIINVNAGAAGASATGLWLYGTSTGGTINQNRITVNCNASAYGLWVESTAGGAVVDTRHNEIIVTAVGAAQSAYVDGGDTWNSTFDKITAASGYSGAGTINYVSSPIDGGLTVDGADIKLRSQGELQFYDNGNYVGFEAPALAADQIWVLPDADGAAGEGLATDGGGNLSWAPTIVNWENTIVVAKSGGDYTTITAAIAAASNDDAILICPGIYSESFTIAKDVSLFGLGHEATVVDGTITIAAGADNITIQNIYINESKSEAGTLYGINVTGGATYVWVKNCRIEITNTHATGLVQGVNNTGSATLYLQECNIVTQTVPGAGEAIGIRTSGAAIITVVQNCDVYGETYDFQQAASGTIYVVFCRYDPTKVSGSVTSELGGRWGVIHLIVDETDISNPPTDAELDAIFGTPASVGEGFAAIINDNGGDTNVYLVTAVGPKWFYEQLTAAV